jgi:hypothetical protein
MGKNEINGLSQSILESVSSQLLEVSKRIDDDIQQASELIINHPGKLVICGLGKSPSCFWIKSCILTKSGLKHIWDLSERGYLKTL